MMQEHDRLLWQLYGGIGMFAVIMGLLFVVAYREKADEKLAMETVVVLAKQEGFVGGCKVPVLRPDVDTAVCKELAEKLYPLPKGGMTALEKGAE